MTTHLERLQATLASLEQTGPDHYDQTAWARRAGGGQFSYDPIDLVDIPALVLSERFDIRKCGSAACFAGHAMLAACELRDVYSIVNGDPDDEDEMDEKIAEYLGIDMDLFGSSLPSSYYDSEGVVQWLDTDGTNEGDWQAVIEVLRREIKLEEARLVAGG